MGEEKETEGWTRLKVPPWLQCDSASSLHLSTQLSLMDDLGLATPCMQCDPSLSLGGINTLLINHSVTI